MGVPTLRLGTTALMYWSTILPLYDMTIRNGDPLFRLKAHCEVLHCQITALWGRLLNFWNKSKIYVVWDRQGGGFQQRCPPSASTELHQKLFWKTDHKYLYTSHSCILYVYPNCYMCPAPDGHNGGLYLSNCSTIFIAKVRWFVPHSAS